MNRMLGLVIVGILCLSMFGLLVTNVKADPSPNARATYTVWPNGHDDTADIQAAFNAAVAHGPGCTVQLEKGTYYTAQITVYGFQGSFVGMGQQWTTIQALQDLPSPETPEHNNPTNPFWTGLPGPTNPWPVLFTFVNGSFSISGMTLTDPYTAPTQGWYSKGGTTPNTSLFTAIEITGQQASATIDHVTVLGAPGDAEGTNMWNAIIYIGQLLPEGAPPMRSQWILLSGTLLVTNNVFNSVESGVWVENLVKAKVTVCYNTLINNPAPLGFDDVSNSTLLFCGNQASKVSYGCGISGVQSLYKPGLSPSTVYITDNVFQVNDGANAVGLVDYGEANFETQSTLNAVVSGNVFQTDTSSGLYVGTDPGDYSVIISEYLKSLVVSGNTILGGGAAGVYVTSGPAVVSGNTITRSYDGVYLDSANGVYVTGNVIKNSAQYGIALTDGSSNNLVAGNIVMNSGLYDLYQDVSSTGTGNVWKGNLYQTCYPPHLG